MFLIKREQLRQRELSLNYCSSLKYKEPLMDTINQQQVAENLCLKLSIQDNTLALGIFTILEKTDFQDRDSITKSANSIKLILKGTSYAAGNSKILDLIAKSIGFKNHHVMWTKISSKIKYPSYIDTMFSNYYINKKVDPESIKKISNIVDDKGLDGLLPKNLPDDLLMDCSIQYQTYRENSEKHTVSLLLFATLFLLAGEHSLRKNGFEINIEPDKVQEYIEMYGIYILLEEMDRANIISIHPHYKPRVKDFFSKNKKTKIDILDEYAFNSYSK